MLSVANIAKNVHLNFLPDDVRLEMSAAIVAKREAPVKKGFTYRLEEGKDPRTVLLKPYPRR